MGVRLVISSMVALNAVLAETAVDALATQAHTGLISSTRAREFPCRSGAATRDELLNSSRLSGFRQHQCSFVVGEQAIKQPGRGQDERSGISLLDDLRVGQRDGLAPLV